VSLATVKIDWDARPYTAMVRRALDEVVREGALQTEEDAKRNLERMAPDSSGTLASEIDIRASEYKDGGWLVEAQGRGNYKKFYASFVELGTSKMEGLAYLRKALRRNRYRMRALLKRKLECEIRGTVF
jgi:hypothetical protein